MGSWMSAIDAQTATAESLKSTPASIKLLPNGKPLPLFCLTCGHEHTGCQCESPQILSQHPPSRSGTIITAASITTAGSSTTSASEQAHIAASASNTTASISTITTKPCTKCKPGVCQCAQVQAERGGIELPILIDNMITFCDSMNKCFASRTGAEKIAERYTLLKSTGEFLKQRDQCIVNNKGKGVLMPSLVARHNAEVQAWLTACDEFNECLCDAIGSILKHEASQPLLVPPAPDASVSIAQSASAPTLAGENAISPKKQ